MFAHLDDILLDSPEMIRRLILLLIEVDWLDFITRFRLYDGDKL